jgi:hypothetical protein
MQNIIRQPQRRRERVMEIGVNFTLYANVTVCNDKSVIFLCKLSEMVR